MVGGGPEGSAFPTVEHILQHEGNPGTLEEILANAFHERACVVTIKVKSGDYKVGLDWEHCKWMQLCVLSWKASEVNRQYDRDWDCLLVAFHRLCPTTVEWWERYLHPLKFHECEWKNLAQALCDYVIYEKGYRMTEAVDAETLKWPPARDYVPFKVKLEWYKKHTNFRVPEE